ncbi:hypothetical protein Pmar_PMAR007365, partial [Perkinsus marinus ATCC 50983]
QPGIPARLLGDAAYPFLPNLLTPIPRPRQNGAADEGLINTYNTCHSSTRFFCEQSFGVLKSRWRSLHTGIRLQQVQATKVIEAAVVLHN